MGELIDLLSWEEVDGERRSSKILWLVEGWTSSRCQDNLQ